MSPGARSHLTRFVTGSVWSNFSAVLTTDDEDQMYQLSCSGYETNINHCHCVGLVSQSGCSESVSEKSRKNRDVDVGSGDGSAYNYCKEGGLVAGVVCLDENDFGKAKIFSLGLTFVVQVILS